MKRTYIALGYIHSLQYSQTLSVDACTVTYFPGPMMVYALSLNIATVLVLGGTFGNVC